MIPLTASNRVLKSRVEIITPKGRDVPDNLIHMVASIDGDLLRCLHLEEFQERAFNPIANEGSMTNWRMTGWVNIRDGFTYVSSPVLIGE